MLGAAMEVRRPGRGLVGAVCLWMVSAPALRAGAEETIGFVDYTVGLRLNVPAGWRYDRSLFAGPDGAVGVLRGRSADGRGSLEILVFRGVRQPLSAWLDGFTRKIGKLAGVDRIAVVGEPRGGLPAAWVVVDAHTPRVRTRTVYYCCRFHREAILVWMRAGVLGAVSQPLPAAPQSPEQIPAALRAEAGSLEILYDPAIEALIRAARLRGLRLLRTDRWLEAVSGLRIDERTHYYWVRVGGRAVGYLTRRLGRERHALDQQARDGKDGLRVHETLWRFEADGSARWQRVDLFSSVDGQTDLYEIVETTIGPAGSKDRAVVRREQCVRQGRTLVRTVTVGGEAEPPAPALPLPADYLGLAWVRVAAGLIGPQAREPVGFVTYDTTTGALVPQVWTARGPTTQPGGGGGYAFEIREGFNPQTARLVVDRWGRMVAYRAGALELVEAEADQIEQVFGARRRAAIRRARAQPKPRAPAAGP